VLVGVGRNQAGFDRKALAAHDACLDDPLEHAAKNIPSWQRLFRARETRVI
jgi:hypothetical protein